MIILGDGITLYEFMTAGSFTWTCPPGVTIAYCQGRAGSGGGAGRSSISSQSRPGGQGCYTHSQIILVTPGVTYDVVVGAGGLGGNKGGPAVPYFGIASTDPNYSSANNGGNGGDTYFELSGNRLFDLKGGLGGGAANSVWAGGRRYTGTTVTDAQKSQASNLFGGCGFFASATSSGRFEAGDSPFALGGRVTPEANAGGGGGGGDGPGGSGGASVSLNGADGADGGGGGGCAGSLSIASSTGGDGADGYLKIITFEARIL